MTEKQQDDLTFEEFQRHVKESEEPCCGICFSFGRYKHLGEDQMKLAYLDFVGYTDKHQDLVVELLEKYKDQPLDDQIYFLVSHCEFFKHPDPAVVDRVLELVLARAHEAVEAKRSGAWVMVRAYGWIEGFDPAKLVEFLDKTNEDDLIVWQVVMQCLGNWALATKLGKDHPSLQVARKKVIEYMDKTMVMQSDIHPIVVYGNGLQAMSALQDPGVLEYTKNHPKPHLLNQFLKDFIDRSIVFLTKQNDPFVSVMIELKDIVDRISVRKTSTNPDN